MSTSDESNQKSVLDCLSQQLLHEVFSYLENYELQPCRLLNRNLSHGPTKLLFSSIRLLSDDEESCSNFVNVAKSKTLRLLVQEFICDAWFNGDEIELMGRSTLYCTFLEVLPHVQFFVNLKTVDIQFSKRGLDLEIMVLEGPIFNMFKRYTTRMIFQCWCGNYSEDFRCRLVREISTLLATPPPQLEVFSDVAMKVRRLAIANAPESYDEALVNSEAFRYVVASGLLTDLRLLLMGDQRSSSGPGPTRTFKDLHRTWLTPIVAQNITTMSLYSHEHCGWCPKVDFRLINPTAKDSALPQLKVLSLGRFDFSHDWQMEWIASLGRDNGGLRELYLDQCTILFQASHPVSLSTSPTVIGHNSDGTAIKISNSRYPERDIDEWQDAKPLTLSRTMFDMRWRHMFTFWKDNMLGLQIIKLKGREPGKSVDDYEGSEYEEDWGEEEDEDERGPLASFHTFRDFEDPPELAGNWYPLDSDTQDANLGVGEPFSARDILQYSLFSVQRIYAGQQSRLTELYIERDDPSLPLPNQSRRDLVDDHAALVELLVAVRARNRNRVQ